MTVLKSSSFSLNTVEMSTWYFKIHLYGSEHSEKDFFGLFLCLQNVGDRSIWASQKYSLVNAKGDWISVLNRCFHEFTKHEEDWGYSRFYSMSKLTEKADIYLPNDELTILCQLTIIDDTKTTSVGRSHVPDAIMNNLANDFARILKNNEFSDVTFQISNKKFQAHKTILAARSPVFSAMFKHPMQERNSNVVTIEDVEPEIFEAMLEYIYTNNVTDIDCTAKDLLPIADQYDLKELVKLCEMSLCDNVTVGNAAEIYILADRHNSDEVLEYMQYFISINLVNVMETSGYKTMEKDYPQLIATFLRKWITPNSSNNEIIKVE